MKRYKKQSAVTFVLKALVPYSRENMHFAFKPNRFFDELEKTSNYKSSTLRNAYWRAGKHGYIEYEGEYPTLTDAGVEQISQYEPRFLGKAASLIVIFDIPEGDRNVRQKFREQLKEWDFVQIQKSVWATDKDYRSLLVQAVSELRLAGYVEIYESVRLFPKNHN